jgi:two-component system NtrC family sensor kinase
MPETKTTRGRWPHLAHSLSTKLISWLLTSLLVIFALLGYLNIRLHRQHLEAATLTSAERVSDVIKRSTTYYMMRYDREGLYRTIQTMADEPGMSKVRILDSTGLIRYSTDPNEVNQSVDKNAEACYACHAQSKPLARLDRPDRLRIYHGRDGQRILGIITPIENQVACSNAACHAHPASQQILGVLDTNLSLAKADAQLAESTNRTVSYTVAAMLMLACLSWLFIVHVVDQPIRALTNGTKRLADGDLGFQIAVRSQDEVGDLALSFNEMSLQLRAANEEIIAWAKTLEDRVEEKTRELKTINDQVLHVEKMASVGKMAAVVAHEINNPLAGILTYSKLIKKWLDQGELSVDKRKEAVECLDLIAGESRRCGDIVKNLLTFSRTAPMNVAAADLNSVIDRSIRLVFHQLEMNGIEVQTDLPSDLPIVQCDAAQVEQVLLALIMNAIDAMPRGGNLWLRTRLLPDPEEVQIEVRDDGTGIPPEILPRMFEPFLTTKESGKGVGLGLAVSRNIVEAHGGRIEVQSELGKGTTFTVTLPLSITPVKPAGPREVAVMNAR